MGWPLLWAARLATDAPHSPEAAARVTELEEELRIQDVWASTTLPAPGLADKVGGQEHQLETLARPSAKLGGCKRSWMKIWAPVTTPG